MWTKVINFTVKERETWGTEIMMRMRRVKIKGYVFRYRYYIRTDGTVWVGMGGYLKEVPQTDTNGNFPYPQVKLRFVGGHKYFNVHFLVVTVFRGPRPPGMVCRHYPDSTKTNNRLENLWWGTPKQNAQDMVEDWSARQKTRNGLLSAWEVKRIRRDYPRLLKGMSKMKAKEVLAGRFQVPFECIYGVVSYRTYKWVR